MPNNLVKTGKRAFSVAVVATTMFWAMGLAAFVPAANAATLQNGDLIKASGLAVYYYQDGKRYVFPNEKTFKTWFVDFSKVKTITDAELANISIGGNVTYRPGTRLVKITTDPKVYAIEPGGVLRWVSSEDVAKSLYGTNWNQQIDDVPDVFFTNYSSGSAISTAVPTVGSLVKTASSPDVYYVDTTGKRKVQDWNAFVGNNFQATFIRTVADSIVTALTAGTAIAGTETAITNLVSTTSTGTGTGTGTTTTTTGSLTVALASTTPASSTVPRGAENVKFANVNLTATGGDVSVTALKVTRTGLGADANLTAVKLFVDDVQKGTSQSLNSAHQASFSLTNSPITITNGKTVTLVIAANIANPPTAYDIHALGINASADITTTAAVNGTFPMTGNMMTLANVDIGSATLYNGALHPTSDTGVDPSITGNRFSQVKITAGSAEAIKIYSITAVKNGTASNSDVKDIVLYDDTNSKTLGTLASLNSDGRAVFSGLDVKVDKGASIELSIKASLAGTGSGRTVAFDLHDGTTYTIRAVGQTYGFEVPMTRNNFCAANGTCQTQTINQGYLTVSKSASTPATGKIAIGGTQIPVVAYEVAVYGEPVNVTSTQIKLTTTGTAQPNHFTSITLYDGTSVIAGPKDATTTTAGGNQTLTFSDSYTLSTGIHTVWVKANISSSIPANQTVVFEMPANTLTAKGANSGKTAYTTSSGSTVAPATVVTGNTLTMQGAGVSVLTAATPVVGNVVTNAQDQVFANFDIDASTGGEDIRISSIKVTDTVTSSTGTVDAASTASTLKTTTDFFTSGDVGRTIYNTTDATSQVITGYTDARTVSTTTAINDTWDGDTVSWGTTAASTAEYTGINNLELWGDPDNTDTSAVNQKLTTSNSTASNANTVTFTFQTPIIVSKNTASRLTLKADVLSTTKGNAHTFKIGATGDITAVGKSTGNNASITISGNGQAQTIQPGGKLKVETADLPAAAQLVSASTNNEVMKYKFSAQYEPVDVTQIPLYYTGTVGNIAKVYIYADGALIGNTSGYTLDPVTKKVTVTLSNGTLVIPKDGYKYVSIKADLTDKTSVVTATAATNFGIGDSNGDNSEWGGAGSYMITATGQSSGAVITPATITNTGATGGNVYGSNNFTVHKGILTVALNSSSPSGTQTSGAGKEVLRVSLTATGDDITITDMSYTKGGTATISGTGDAKWVSEDLNTTYYSWSGATAWLNTSRKLAGGAAGSALTISAGTTKVIKLVGDTSGPTAQQTLQFSIAPAAGLTSGIIYNDTSGTAIDLTTTKNLPVYGGGLTY